MKTNLILHNCRKGLRDEELGPEKMYSIMDLFHHLLNECPRKENICPNCGGEFGSIEETWNHLKHECLYVTLKCSYCDEKMYRGEFKQHKCWEYGKKFRNVITDQNQRYVKYQEKQEDLQEELRNTQMERRVQAEEFRDKRAILKDKLKRRQKNANEQFMMTNDFKISHDNAKASYN